MALHRPTSLFLLGPALGLIGFVSSPGAQLQGVVVDTAGSPLSRAQVHWIEADITVTTDAEGVFDLPTLALGDRRQRRPSVAWSPSPQGLVYRFSGSTGRALARLSLFDSKGRNLEESWVRGSEGYIDLSRIKAAPVWARMARLGQVEWTRLGKSPEGWHASPVSVTQVPAAARALARLSADPMPRMTLDTKAAGYATRRLAFLAGQAATITLLPANASLREKLRLMLGDSLALRVAWLQTRSDRQSELSWADLADLDTSVGRQGAVTPSHWKAKTLAASRAATLPSWSPDGTLLAYENGRESATTDTSRIYLHPLDGSRVDGPAHPATNPRFTVVDGDTSLVWSTSGKGAGYDETTSSTKAQSLRNGNLIGQARTLASGSYNAGLSRDGRYLAAAFPLGYALDLETQERRRVHHYPGAANGNDNPQVCNGSISQDPLHPGRMLFIDFGVNDEPGYNNLIKPQLYAQHRMLLLADYAADAPGRIVDFIDTPAEALALDKSWEDPEWSTHPDFAIATTRLDDGNTLSQPDIYLIRLSTHESMRLFSGDHFFMPVAWVGRR